MIEGSRRLPVRRSRDAAGRMGLIQTLSSPKTHGHDFRGIVRIALS